MNRWAPYVTAARRRSIFGQTGSPFGLASSATRPGVTEHQLSDALAIGAINPAAAMLGTTVEVIATKLGVFVADLRVALTTTTTR